MRITSVPTCARCLERLVFASERAKVPRDQAGYCTVVRYLKQAEPASRQSNRDLTETVRRMLEDVEQNRDEAVRRYAQQLDR
jgi:hypothetical protein